MIQLFFAWHTVERWCLDCLTSYVQATDACPQATDACPQATDACPQATDACPQAADACPQATDACPQATDACPQVVWTLLQFSIMQEAVETFFPDVWRSIVGIVKNDILDFSILSFWLKRHPRSWIRELYMIWDIIILPAVPASVTCLLNQNEAKKYD